MTPALLIIAGLCFAAAILGGWYGLRDFDPLNPPEEER